MIAVLLLGAGIVLAAAEQAPPGAPPVKMGLWETETASRMVMPNMPNMPQGMGARTVKVHSCLTPESYAKAWADSTQQRGADCKRTNEKWTTGSYSFDVSCSGRMTMSGHFVMNVDSQEAAHGSMDMQVEGGQGPAAGMTSHTDLKTKYLSSDCGSVKPGAAEVIR